MPTIHSPEERQRRYEKLPDVLKRALYSADLAERIFEIGKKSGLTIEKIGFLAEEAGLVVLGLTHPNEFVPALKTRLEVSEDAARKIASEVNHQIFFPLRESLKTTHQFDVREEAIQAPIEPPRPKPPLQTPLVSGIRSAAPLTTPPSPAPRPAPPLQPPAPPDLTKPTPTTTPPAPGPSRQPPSTPAPPRPTPTPAPQPSPPPKPAVPKESLPLRQPPAPTPPPSPAAPTRPPPPPPTPRYVKGQDPYREEIE